MPLKIQSPAEVAAQALDTLKRFPLSVTCAMGSTIIAIISIDGASAELTWLLFAAISGVFVFAAAQLINERGGVFSSRPSIAPASAAVLLTVLWASGVEEAPAVRCIYALQACLAAYMALCVIPAPGRESDLDGWWHGLRLLEATVTAFFISAMVFIALSAGLAIFIFLFEVEGLGFTYFRLWIVCAALLAPWLALRLIPRPGEPPSGGRPYPQRLGIIARNLLVPIFTVYVLLLFAYSLKIAVFRDWPKGTLGTLIAAVATLGVGTWLALLPAAEKLEGLARLYHKNFFRTLIPLLLLQLMAISRRTGEYGWTERRVLLAVFALWMLGLCAYFILSRRPDCRMVPASLSALALTTLLGPLSATSIAVRSQISRLEATLTRVGWLKDGKLVSPPSSIEEEDRRAVEGALLFLTERRRQERLRRWLGPGLFGLSADQLSRRLGSSDIVSGQPLWLSACVDDPDAPVFISGFTYAWRFSAVNDHTRIPGTAGDLSLSTKKDALNISLAGRPPVTLSLKNLLDEVHSRTRSGEDDVTLPAKSMRLPLRISGHDIALHLTCLRMRRNASLHLESVEGLLLLK